MEREVPGGPSGLTVKGVSVRFGGVRALEDVSLEISSREVLGVIGPNGAGKTTLFNVITGFVKPDAGALTWRTTSLVGVRPDRLTRLGIARTLQGVGLFPRMTALENVVTGATRFRRAGVGSALLGLPRSDRDERALRARAREALSRVGCTGVDDRLPSTLPYAVQKRIALARALVSEPELLLLDEPAGGLDARDLSDLAELVTALGDAIAVMLVDHHMDFVTSVCDRMVVLDFGRVIATGDPAAVRQDPLVLEAYLGRDADEEEAADAAGAGDARG